MESIKNIKVDDILNNNMDGQITFKRNLIFTGNEQYFKESIKGIKNKVYGVKYPYENYKRDVAITSANIYNFLPKVNAADYDSFVRDIYYNECMGMLELGSYYSLCESKFENLGDIKDAERMIITTFHHGPYRVLPPYLLSRGFDVILLINKEDIEKLQVFFSFFVEIINKKFNTNSSLNLVAASNNSSLTEMSRLLRDSTKKRIAILAYLDAMHGNLGNNLAHKSSSISTYPIKNFLGRHTIRVRKGIPFLSHFLKLPIFNVIGKRGEDDLITFKITDKFCPDNFDRHEYDSIILDKLHKRLEELIYENPSIWAGWHYVHKMMDEGNLNADNIKVPIKEKQVYKFNTIDFTMYTIENDYYLFDRRNYMSFLIDKKLYEMFVNDQELKQKDVEPYTTSFGNLIAKNVLV